MSEYEHGHSIGFWEGGGASGGRATAVIQRGVRRQCPTCGLWWRNISRHVCTGPLDKPQAGPSLCAKCGAPTLPGVAQCVRCNGADVDRVMAESRGVPTEEMDYEEDGEHRDDWRLLRDGSDYGTHDEISFVRGLRGEAFWKYAALVECGMRAYGPGVDRDAVVEEIRRLKRER